MDIKNKALVLRTCKADGTSYRGFKWPSELGSIVKCNDWKPVAECGNGLHGLLDGWGNYGLLSNAHDAIWQIVEVDRDKCIAIDGKVKFESCTLIYSGDMAIAMAKMADYQIDLLLKNVDKNTSEYVAYSQLAASGDDSILATSGDFSKLAASGDRSRLAASGDDSILATSGDFSKLAASGDRSQLAASGNNSQLAASGDFSKLAASGYCSRLAASGYYSKLSASGYYSKLSASGDRSQLATSGDDSILATSGDFSKLAASGDNSLCTASGKKSITICAGLNSSVSAGEDGCIALAWWDDEFKRHRLEVGYVGENGIKANKLYMLDENHNFIEVA